MMQVSSNPHIRSTVTTNRIMMTVAAALLPSCIFGIYNFGFYALFLILLTVFTCVATEHLFCILVKNANPDVPLNKRETSIGDFSAVVTGLLLAMNLPPRAPWWIAVIGGMFAILVVKMIFGGLGQNFMNPALGARCFLLISFTSKMTSFVESHNPDVVSQATPLALVKAGEKVNALDMVIGNISGTIGETSVVAIVFGAIILILTGVIDLKIPASYIISFSVFIVLFSGHGFNPQFLTVQLAGGGLMLGAFFMATDYVTCPITTGGRILFGILLGVLTGIFRLFGASAEGVSYAIIIGNLLVPLIEKITWPKAFGKGGEAL